MAAQQFTAEQVITALKETKGLIFLAAKRLGCHAHTVMNYIARYPTVKQALQECRGEMVDISESSLFRAILNGEAWAVQFHLKTQGKDRGYFDKSQIELEQVRQRVVEEVIDDGDRGSQGEAPPGTAGVPPQ